MRFLGIFFAVLIACSGLVRADGHIPGLFKVTGVASDDTLNVRRGPGTGYEILGAFPPDRRDIEINALSDNGKWGRTNFNDEAGWVSMRFLTAQAGSAVNLPFGLTCAGTEPFWSLTFNADETASGEFWPMGLVDDGTTEYGAVWASRPANRITPKFGFRLMAETTRHGIRGSGIIRTQECSDGMSDRDYGFAIDLLLTGGGQRLFVDGCCSISGD